MAHTQKSKNKIISPSKGIILRYTKGRVTVWRHTRIHIVIKEEFYIVSIKTSHMTKAWFLVISVSVGDGDWEMTTSNFSSASKFGPTNISMLNLRLY